MSAPFRLGRLIVKNNAGGIAIVSFLDRSILDVNDIQTIGNNFFTLIDYHKRNRVVLDFEAVLYLSYVALLPLDGFKKKLEKNNGCLAICNVAGRVLETFQTNPLGHPFIPHIKESQPAALELLVS